MMRGDFNGRIKPPPPPDPTLNVIAMLKLLQMDIFWLSPSQYLLPVGIQTFLEKAADEGLGMLRYKIT